MSILVTGTIDLDPANRDGFIAAANEVMAATRAEDGNEHYAFSADLERPGPLLRGRAVGQPGGDGHPHGHAPTWPRSWGPWAAFGVTGASLTKWDGATPSKLM